MRYSGFKVITEGLFGNKGWKPAWRELVKTLDKLTASRHGEIIRVEASARSFLHNQVRSMVGSLKLVGEGKWSAADLQAALAAKDRARCGPVAPAHGLYLVRVDY
jgi:tRNA pseudouridine38-40 synthase